MAWGNMFLVKQIFETWVNMFGFTKKFCKLFKPVILKSINILTVMNINLPSKKFGQNNFNFAPHNCVGWTLQALKCLGS